MKPGSSSGRAGNLDIMLGYILKNHATKENTIPRNMDIGEYQMNKLCFIYFFGHIEQHM
jgi:hypothetical protein